VDPLAFPKNDDDDDDEPQSQPMVFDFGAGFQILGEPRWQRFQPEAWKQRFFVRECYVHIAKAMLALQSGSIAILFGTPGIGKTYFGFYLLLCLAKLGRTVVYQRKDEFRYLFTPDLVASCPKPSVHTAFEEHLEKTTTYFIVDGIKPDERNATTILLSSPRLDRINEVRKKANAQYYMPTWTLDEVLLCNQHLYGYNHGVIQQAFARWGGVPRYVIEFLSDEEQQNQLGKAIEEAAKMTLGELATKLKGGDEGSHFLFHLAPSPDFRKVTYRFASRFVEIKVMEKIREKSMDSLFAIVKDAQDVNSAHSFSGTVFESVAHVTLQRGGVFRIKNLENGAVGEINLPLREEIAFSSADVIPTLDANGYLRPAYSTFESIDALVKPNLLFQMTVSLSHPCKQAGLYDVLVALGKTVPGTPVKKKRKLDAQPPAPILGFQGDPVRLYFVVPDFNFGSFQKQRYTNASGNPLDASRHTSVNAIQQFALEIKITNQ